MVKIPKRTFSEAFSPAQQRLFLHPASPVQQQRPGKVVEGQESITSASAAAAAAPTAGGVQKEGRPHHENRPLPSGKPTDAKMPSKVRSSIACARCRRSKVKCVNSGVNTTCKACESTGRECLYPPSVPGSTPKRTEITGGIKGEEGENVKKRIRKTETDPSRNGAPRHEPVVRVEHGPLDTPVLTAAVWNEIFEIFKLHFSTELSFLHQPTFLARVRQVMRRASGPHARGFEDDAIQSPPTSGALELPDTKALLLGILTLTARFHPGLTQHHSLGPNHDPQVASEYYATALTARLNAVTLTTPSIELIQALLMLGLHEWGMCRGKKSFLLVGMAVRMAQVMGLESEDDREPEAQPTTTSSSSDEAEHSDAKPTDFRVRNESDEVIESEVRRRTLWSCFIMDRMLTGGKRRRSIINVEDLCVQLPCSEEAFSFGERVLTGILTDGREPVEPMNNERWRERSHGCVNDDGVLSRFIKMIEIWGRFCRWSCTGGRRNEKYPPWDSKTQFFKLRRELDEFVNALPNKLAFSRNNLSAHISSRTSTTYIRLHTLYALCVIMLHREYIPFVPIRSKEPEGPLDHPIFPPDKFEVPSGFWKESAEAMYKAAKDIMDVVRECQENFSLPITPQLGFAVYTAGFVGVVAKHFPHMDTKKQMCDPNTTGDEKQGQWRGPTQLAISTLNAMKPKIMMSHGWCETLAKMDKFYYRIKEDYAANFKRPWSHGRNVKGEPHPDRKLSIRYGGYSGGLEEYTAFEPELNEFGSLKDHERKNTPSGSSRASTGGPAVNSESKSEEMQGVESSSMPNMTQWQAINAASSLALSREQEASAAGYAQQQTGCNFYAVQASPNQTAGNPPSLVSPSTSGSTPGALRSPFSRSEQDAAPYHNGVPANNIFPSVVQHSQPPIMAPPRNAQSFPPTSAVWDPQYVNKEDRFFARYENLNMQSTDINIFNEGVPMDAAMSEVAPPNQEYWANNNDGFQYGDGTNGANWSQAVYGAFPRVINEHQRFTQTG